jgi:ketosteroid isomerase-like protein
VLTELSAQRVVDDVLTELVEALDQRNLAGVLDLFGTHRPALYGSALGESAVGARELRAFFENLFGRSETVGWTWGEPVVGWQEDVLWYVAAATCRIRGEGRPERVLPYRLSGVLQRHDDGRWRIELFNGAEPSAA